MKSLLMNYAVTAPKTVYSNPRPVPSPAPLHNRSDLLHLDRFRFSVHHSALAPRVCWPTNLFSSFVALFGYLRSLETNSTYPLLLFYFSSPFRIQLVYRVVRLAARQLLESHWDAIAGWTEFYAPYRFVIVREICCESMTKLMSFKIKHLE
jgi:hypothetical protein